MHVGERQPAGLEPGWAQVVVSNYRSGRMERLHEVLIPKSHLNNDQEAPLLRSLVCSFGGLGFEQIVASHLNTRSRQPETPHPLPISVSYPAPGVRRACCGTDVVAWVDWVVSPRDFRQHQRA